MRGETQSARPPAPSAQLSFDARQDQGHATREMRATVCVCAAMRVSPRGCRRGCGAARRNAAPGRQAVAGYNMKLLMGQRW